MTDNPDIKDKQESKIVIENTPETFDKLMKLCNFYNKSFKEYNRVLLLLQSCPRTPDGNVRLTVDVLDAIEHYIDGYEGLNAYAARIMQKEITIH
jgi:hypothetical protein